MGDLAIAKMIFELEEKIDLEVPKTNEILDKLSEKVRGKRGKTGDRGEKGDRGERGKEGKVGKSGKNGKDGKKGDRGERGSDGLDGKDGKDGVDGKDGSPDTPEQVRDKLSSLRGENRLDANAIKGLEDMLKDLEGKINQAPKMIIGGASRFVPKVMVDDFSDQTDGETKTFYLSKAPMNINLTKVWGSDFPYILRVNTDFTISGKLLTLTSEVDAPSSGATLIVEYYV